jgi:hypothetical protein
VASAMRSSANLPKWATGGLSSFGMHVQHEFRTGELLLCSPNCCLIHVLQWKASMLYTPREKAF